MELWQLDLDLMAAGVDRDALVNDLELNGPNLLRAVSIVFEEDARARSARERRLTKGKRNAPG